METLLSPYGGNTKPLQALKSLLQQQGAKTVVLEENYVDKDYQNEFSAFYSRSFKIYPQRCTRLHFFSTDIPEQTVAIDLVNLQDCYLGFVVIRPTDLQRLGRTLLKPFIHDIHTEFVCCKAEFDAHILGERFPVTAMPFIQQDTQVGACAQASLWMLARYMSKRYGYREFLPGEINILAKSIRAYGRALPAEWGLDLGQILDALSGMGYSAVVYARENIDQCSPHIDDIFPVDSASPATEQETQIYLQRTAKLADITYRYVESGLPVILCTANHALVAIGHTYNYTVEARLAIERIPAFIVNNDAEGPYCKIPIRLVSPWPRYPDEISFRDICEIVVVVPPEVTLRGEEAESMASEHVRDFLESDYQIGKKWRQALIEMRPEFQSWFEHLEFRTYLRPSVEWQKELRQYISGDPIRRQVARRLLELDYPKYVWLTEVSSSPLLNRALREQRQCLGCIVVDSTAPACTRGTIAMHFADVLFILDRQRDQEQPEVHYIKGSTPFSHKIW